MERSVKKAFPSARAHYLPNLLSEWRDQTKPLFEFRPQAPWLHVNPTAVKGISFVLELAEKMPSEKFLLVGNWGSTFPDRLPQNVSTQSRQENLKEILKRVKGVLMPSVWQEAFGRVPLEAMAMGVPVISSDRGALPETVAQGGLVLPLEFDLWQRAMQQTESFWKHQVDAGWKRFCDYRTEVDRVYAALKDRLSVLK
jgi:glycosyltransferase involved in cell wall biosynthesis